MGNLTRPSAVITLLQIWTVWSLRHPVLNNYYRQIISLSHPSATLQAFTKCHTKLPLRLTTFLLRTVNRYFQHMKEVTLEIQSLTKILWMTLILVIQVVVVGCIGHPLLHQTSSSNSKLKYRSSWTCKISTNSITERSTTTLIIRRQLAVVYTLRVISSKLSHKPSLVQFESFNYKAQ